MATRSPETTDVVRVEGDSSSMVPGSPDYLVTRTTRKQVWTLLHEVVRLSRYYQYVIHRLRSQHRAALVVQVIIATGGGVLVLIPSTEEIISALTIFAVAFVSVLFLVFKYPEKSSMATQMSERCSKVEIDARKLWVDMDTWKISEAEASARWHEIETKLDAATALETHLGTYKRINRRAEADAAKLVKEEYA